MTTKLSGVSKLTEQEKVAAFNMAIHCITQMHQNLLPSTKHVPEVLKCGCTYSVAFRTIVNLRNRAYQAIRAEAKR